MCYIPNPDGPAVFTQTIRSDRMISCYESDDQWTILLTHIITLKSYESVHPGGGWGRMEKYLFQQRV